MPPSLPTAYPESCEQVWTVHKRAFEVVEDLDPDDEGNDTEAASEIITVTTPFLRTSR